MALNWKLEPELPVALLDREKLREMGTGVVKDAGYGRSEKEAECPREETRGRGKTTQTFSMAPDAATVHRESVFSQKVMV